VTRKRRVFYPPSRSSKGPPPVSRVPLNPPTLAVINPDAGLGRTDLAVGMRVTIQGSGADAGETAVVERLVGGVIPAAVVRTESGRTRRARMVDLVPSRASDRSPDQG
jgi:hypothetical protein